MTMSKAPDRARCSAHRKNGDQCRNAPIAGTNVCRVHGGMAPQVRKKAQERIAMAADPAAAKLVQLMNDKKVPYAIQLAAARDLLDRAGISRTATVEVELRPFEQLIESGELLIDIEPSRDGRGRVMWDDEAAELVDVWEPPQLSAKEQRRKRRYSDAREERAVREAGASRESRP